MSYNLEAFTDFNKLVGRDLSKKPLTELMHLEEQLSHLEYQVLSSTNLDEFFEYMNIRKEQGWAWTLFCLQQKFIWGRGDKHILGKTGLRRSQKKLPQYQRPI